jgi:predicted Fe-Mo cluster-binding NifX family protein
MKVVIPVMDQSAGRVSEHLGRAPYLAWYKLENEAIAERGTIINDCRHFGGNRSPPELIAELGAGVVIGYGMGDGALSSLKEKNIMVLEAISPSPIQNLNAYVKGKLKELSRGCHLDHRSGVVCR